MDPAVQKRIVDVGQELVPRADQTPQALAAHHKAEIEKWASMIKAANIKAPAPVASEPGCAPGYWRLGRVCVSQATGDVELADENVEPGHTAIKN
jgi:hypothetical protein